MFHSLCRDVLTVTVGNQHQGRGNWTWAALHFDGPAEEIGARGNSSARSLVGHTTEEADTRQGELSAGHHWTRRAHPVKWGWLVQLMGSAVYTDRVGKRT